MLVYVYQTYIYVPTHSHEINSSTVQTFAPFTNIICNSQFYDQYINGWSDQKHYDIKHAYIICCNFSDEKL